jgi:hypothetical protein
MKLWGLGLLLLCCVAKAQQVSPVVSECGLKCKGEFSVRNNTTKPELVSIDIRSLEFKEGKPVDVELSKNVQVQLDSQTARVSPLSEHVFTYRLICNVSPCVVKFGATFPGGKVAGSGAQLFFRLPSVVYSCSHQKNCRANTLKAMGMEVK